MDRFMITLLKKEIDIWMAPNPTLWDTDKNAVQYPSCADCQP